MEAVYHWNPGNPLNKHAKAQTLLHQGFNIVDFQYLGCLRLREILQEGQSG